MVGYFIQIPYEVLYDVSKYLVRGKVVCHEISASWNVACLCRAKHAHAEKIRKIINLRS